MRDWLQSDGLRPPRGHREELLRFLVVGGCGYLLALLFYAGELALGISPYAAVPCVFVANGLFNVTLNRHWSFPPSGRRVRGELGRFAVVATVSLVVNYTALYVLYELVGLPALLAQALAIIAAIPVGFVGNKFFSFAHAGPEAIL